MNASEFQFGFWVMPVSSARLLCCCAVVETVGFIGRTGHLVLHLGGLLFSVVTCKIHITLLSVFPSLLFSCCLFYSSFLHWLIMHSFVRGLYLAWFCYSLFFILLILLGAVMFSFYGYFLLGGHGVWVQKSQPGPQIYCGKPLPDAGIGPRMPPISQSISKC